MLMNETISAGAYLGSTSIFKRFMELLTAPYNHSELLWTAVPLFIVLIFMNLYFGRYREEELGWNTALGNSLALFFVSADLIRFLYNRVADPSFWILLTDYFKEISIVLIFALSGAWLFIADFFHLLPKKMAFLLSSSTSTLISVYLAIVIIYTQLPIDTITILSALIFALLLVGLLRLFKFLVPIYVDEK